MVENHKSWTWDKINKCTVYINSSNQPDPQIQAQIWIHTDGAGAQTISYTQ